MGKGTKESPYTREDMLKLIKNNGGTAEGLDLSETVFKDEIDLSDLNLRKIILNNSALSYANFNSSNLSDAKLIGANLEGAKFNKLEGKPSAIYANLTSANFDNTDLRESEFIGAFMNNSSFVNANLSDADLSITEKKREPDLLYTDFRGANLFSSDFTNRTFHFSKLEGAYLNWAKITEAYSLGDADWGNYVIGEEKKNNFYAAKHRYRHLKNWYTDNGYYDIAGIFFYREMEAKRKALKWLPNPLPRIWSMLLSIICGYGEKPFRVIASALAVVLCLALIYFASGTLTPNTFLNSLYYSAVSFTALGYGSWVSEPVGYAKGLGAFESFLGVFMMALFLVTFTRKMTR